MHTRISHILVGATNLIKVFKDIDNFIDGLKSSGVKIALLCNFLQLLIEHIFQVFINLHTDPPQAVLLILMFAF